MNQGITYADYSQLKSMGISNVINKGINPLGLTERTIICNDGSVWDYCAEDGLYEKRVDTFDTTWNDGYWYTDKNGNPSHTWDFEQSIGE
jgi:hypothetical protein